MARGQRKRDAYAGEPLAPTQRALPELCPLCGVSSPDEPHLRSHAPGELCQHCDGKEKAWRLDLDGTVHFRTDVSVFYCSNCGHYAALPVREEVSPSGEA
jgi:predicted RNA-binding Zn-ribbon protein involved in translation (DUF1610 family)